MFSDLAQGKKRNLYAGPNGCGCVWLEVYFDVPVTTANTDVFQYTLE